MIDKLAKILSRLFSPLLVPTYAIIAAMWGTTLAVTPDTTKIRVAAMTLLITGAVPGIVIAILHRINKISDTTLSDRKERTIPYAVASLCYLAEIYYLITIHAPMWLCISMMAATVALIICMSVNYFWKISGHACGIGAIIGMMMWLIANDLARRAMFYIMLIAIIILGLVSVARLYRGLHTLAQVVIGAIVGIGALILIPSLLTTII